MSDARADKVREAMERDLRSAWGAMLNSPAGRLVVWAILEKCHVFQTSYTGGADTYFREGERSVGLRLLHDHIFPLGTEYLGQMMADHADRLEQIEQALDEEEQE